MSDEEMAQQIPSLMIAGQDTTVRRYHTFQSNRSD